MDVNELVNLLGHSHKNKMANAKLKELGFKITDPNFDYKGVPYLVNFKHKKMNVELQFNGFRYYKRNYGEPKNYEEGKSQELIFHLIMIELENKSSPEELTLPFGLEPFFDYIDVLELIKKDSNFLLTYIWDRQEHIRFYYKENRVEVSFFESGKIKSLYITLIKKKEKIRNKLELELDFQSRNIKLENLKNLSYIDNPAPELDWNYQADLGAKKSKRIVADIYKRLKKNLIHFTENRDPVGIYHSVKKIYY